MPVDNLVELFYGVFETARYPVSFFKGVGRALVPFVVPVAFATTFSVEALLGVADPRLLVVGVLLSGVALAGTRLFWNYALRFYSSASS